MRRRDKINNIQKANILAEQRYLQSKGFITEANDNLTDCDCCKYFDMDTDRFGGLEHPIYYALNKSEIHELKSINPETYLKTVAENFKMHYHEMFNYINQELVDKYANDMKNGDKFPLPYYTLNDKQQEGRHRALALKKLNCNNMPVVVVIKLSDKEKDQFANKYKNMSTEELNQEFINLGYEGVSGLDIRELKNYIRYREL